MVEQSPWVDPINTVDNIKFGDGGKLVKKVAVCWFSSLKNIEAAINLNCDLLITHEPVWWDHYDAPGGWHEKDPGLKKTKLLEKSRMVIARLHDTWDNWPELEVHYLDNHWKPWHVE